MIAVIGTGPAGLSAATYLKRANIPVMAFTNHKSSLAKAALIENYYGVGQIKGIDLYNNGIKNAKELEIPIIEDTIINIECKNEFILTGLKETYQAKAIILATGSQKKALNIPGIREYEGQGISYCSSCDGYFFKNKNIALIGHGEYANHEYKYLSNITNKITRFSNNPEYLDKSFINEHIKEINKNDNQLTIILNNGNNLVVDGIFIATNDIDTSVLAKKIGIIIENNSIITDIDMKTNIPGIFACGDNTKGNKQIAKAVYEGLVAATACIKYYNEKKEG